jgi:hypothetical protein
MFLRNSSVIFAITNSANATECPLGALLFVGTVDTAEMSSKTEQNYHKCG